MSVVANLQTKQSRKPEHQQNRKELSMHQVAGLMDPRMFDNAGLSFLSKSLQSIIAQGKAVRRSSRDPALLIDLSCEGDLARWT